MSAVWIVDDHNSMRASLSRLLTSEHGVTSVETFASCEDALAELARGRYPQLLLLDIGLQGMSGLDGIPLIRERAPEVSIVVLTVFEDDEKLFRAICAGANGYLLKTQSGQEIIHSVWDALDGGAPMSPRIARRVLEMFAKLAPRKTDYGLSERERAVLELVVEGLLKKEIAQKMGLSIHTVDSYLRRIYEKLHVNSRSGAVRKAVREGLV
jgi:DNA-binding NarL/FixJ family response regulator